MRPPVNLEREIQEVEQAQDLPQLRRFIVILLKLLVSQFQDIYNRLGTSVSVTGSSFSGGSTVSSGTSAPAVVLLSNTFTAVEGTNTITIPATVIAANGITSSDYVVFAFLQASDGSFKPLAQPESKTSTTFTYQNLDFSGTVYYVPIAKG